MGTWQQPVASVDGPFLYFKEWGISLIRVLKILPMNNISIIV